MRIVLVVVSIITVGAVSMGVVQSAPPSLTGTLTDFSNDTPALAPEVNSNFTAVENAIDLIWSATSVDDSFSGVSELGSRVDAIEASPDLDAIEAGGCEPEEFIQRNGSDDGWQCASAGGGGGDGNAFVPGTQVFSANAPTDWTDLDLSGVVGVNVAYVMMKFVVGGSSLGYTRLRVNGETVDINHNRDGMGTTFFNANNVAYLAMFTDANGILEWKADNGNSVTISVEGFTR